MNGCREEEQPKLVVDGYDARRGARKDDNGGLAPSVSAGAKLQASVSGDVDLTDEPLAVPGRWLRLGMLPNGHCIITTA